MLSKLLLVNYIYYIFNASPNKSQMFSVCVRARSPLGVLVLHVTEPGDGARQLLPERAAVPDLHRLVHQHHRRQHLHGDQQLGVGQRALRGQRGQMSLLLFHQLELKTDASAANTSNTQ